jgi:hypothetical protein
MLPVKCRQASGEPDETPLAHEERTFRRHIECDILAHCFAPAWCATFQYEFLIAYSCKGRSECPY